MKKIVSLICAFMVMVGVVIPSQSYANNVDYLYSGDVEDYMYIYNSNGLVLDVSGGVNRDGTNIQMWEYIEGNPNQLFMVRIIGDNINYIVSKIGGRFVDIFRGTKQENPTKQIRFGLNVDIWQNNDPEAQKFHFWEIAEGQYVIESAAKENAVLTAQGAWNGANVSLEEFTGADSQIWYLGTRPKVIKPQPLAMPNASLLQDAVGKYVMLHNMEGGVMDVYCAINADGTNLQICEAGKQNPAQMFLLQDLGGGRYALLSKIGNKYVDIFRGTKQENPSRAIRYGLNVDIWQNNDPAAQQFFIHDMGAGYYKIESTAKKDAVLSAAGSANGSNISLEKSTDSTFQRWYFEIVPDVPAPSNAVSNVRTTAPATNNSYYYSRNNIYYSAGYGPQNGHGNCTWYALGRYHEITGKNLYNDLRIAGHAKTWLGIAQRSPHYSTGSTPKVGAIGVCRSGKWGHVFVVEKIENGRVYISESHWTGAVFDYRELPSWYKVAGYIYP